MLPKKGNGISVSVDHANNSIIGDLNYTRFTADIFINYAKGPGVLYSRIKAVGMEGTPAVQNMLAITDDVPIYFPTLNFLDRDEVVNPRGWQNSRWGNRLVFGTLEYRVGSEKVSIALISDVANAWVSGSDLQDWIITAGYELRGNVLGLVIACGQAQTIDGWQDKLEPETYLRLTLINPF